MGRIARAEGTSAVVPPFCAPDSGEMRRRLVQAGLPEDGMEGLTVEGEKLPCRSTVGWVYWGRLFHIARHKIHAAVGKSRGQILDDRECQVLRQAGAVEVILELFHTCAAEREDVDRLARTTAEGPAIPPAPPSPQFTELARRLAAAGIRADLEGEQVTVRFERPREEILELARPVPHPWLPGRTLSEIGPAEGESGYEAVVAANDRAARMLQDGAPEPLEEKASQNLELAVKEYFDGLLTPDNLRFRTRVLFSGRTVIVPGPDLPPDQVGLAEEIAWTLFGPLVERGLVEQDLVARELGGEEEVRARTQLATDELDRVMERSWVIVHRAPAMSPTSFVAFRPVRCPDRVIRLHPLMCRMMNVDFDGDQAAIFLPLTEEAQRKARERLSVAGQLARNPGSLLAEPVRMDAMFGLAWLSLTEEGLAEIVGLAGTGVRREGWIVTRDSIAEALHRLLGENGVEEILAACDRLMKRGFGAARGLGA